MHSDLTGKLPAREHIENIRKILQTVKEFDKTYFATACIVHIINAGIPNLTLLLSAWLLDGMAQGKSFKELFSVAAGVMAAIFVLHLLVSEVWNRLEVRKEQICWKYHCSTEEKMLDIDYARLDDPVVKDLKKRMQSDMNWGAGLYSVFWQGNGVLYRIFHLLFGCMVALPVLSSLFLSDSLLKGCILLLLLTILVISSILSNRYQKKVTSYQYYKPATEEEYEQWCCCIWPLATGEGFSYQNGKDARIYDSYNLFKSHTTDKNANRCTRSFIFGMARAAAASGLFSAVSRGITDCGSFLVAGLSALAGNLSLGNALRLAGCLQGVISDIGSLFFEISTFALTARRHRSTLDLLQIENEMYQGKLPVEKRQDNEYQIEFRDVSFRYPGSGQYAIRHLSLKLCIGEKLAIVGMNGSGKTTLIKLLCRLYDPNEGEILLNGVDIRKFKQEEYAALFSVVFQDYELFSFPLGENVAITEHFNEEQVKSCLESAGFGERLRNLENGVNTWLYKDYDDSGVEISGGEAQKIAIARAICKDAPFILLDEPTAALDPLSEYEIYTSFDKVIGTKTAIYISHRLSSCRFCEKIAVFHQGELVQTGSHEELLRDTAGKYYELWQSQAQYYQSSSPLV